MKTIMTKAMLSVAVLSFSIMAMGAQFSSANEPDGKESFEPAYQISGTLSDEAKEAILFMREEEKLARDVYLYLYDIYPLRPFANISKSEQVHMDAILYLINLYGLEDPVKDNPEGKFKNEELQTMYNDLIKRGSESKTEALKVGALIEEIDIIDLEESLQNTGQNEDIMRVYTNLCNASKNHLRAFVRVLSLNGINYEPVKLDNETFRSIIN